MQASGNAGGDEEAAEARTIPFTPDIQSDNKRLYQWAGIDIGTYNCMLLQKTLKSLAVSGEASSLRLWGKIKGTQKDYYVIEGTSS